MVVGHLWFLLSFFSQINLFNFSTFFEIALICLLILLLNIFLIILLISSIFFFTAIFLVLSYEKLFLFWGMLITSFACFLVFSSSLCWLCVLWALCPVCCFSPCHSWRKLLPVDFTLSVPTKEWGTRSLEALWAWMGLVDITVKWLGSDLSVLVWICPSINIGFLYYVTTHLLLKTSPLNPTSGI